MTRQARQIVPIVLVFVVLGVTYSVVNPIFEAPDELYHFAFIRHLAGGHGLPVQKPESLGPWRQEGSQPPLYYLLGALATFWIDTGDAPQQMRTNPHAAIGHPTSDGNKNVTLHGPDERFPYRRTTLAVHLVRLMSVGLGAMAVVMVYLIAQELFPQDCLVPIVAASLIAFDPQFLFITSAVSNDGLITALAGLTGLLALQLARPGGDHPGTASERSRREAIALGVTLGLALLTKLSALTLLVVVAAALAVGAWRRRSWPFLWRTGAVVFGVAMATAGWWYLRNWLLYGDPTGLNAMLEVVRPRKLPWQQLLGELKGIELSFWAVFGWFNVLADGVVYRFVEVLLRVSLVGLAVGLVRRRWTGSTALDLAVLALWVGVTVGAIFRWTSITLGSQGRLLFPAAPAIGLFLALGLLQLPPQRYRMPTAVGIVGILFVIALVAPFRYIAPAYAPPPILSQFDEADVAERVDLRFGENSPWTGEQQAPEGVGGAGGDNWATEGTDSLSTRAPGGGVVPSQKVGANPCGRPPGQAQDLPLPQVIEKVRGVVPVARLIGYELAKKGVNPGDPLTVTLFWRALAPMTEAYSVYIHLRSPDGVLLGQRDSYPGRGSYPTVFWQPGQVIVDTYQVRITESAVGPAMGRLEVGLYTFHNLQRLPVFDSLGNPIAPVIGRFKINGPGLAEVAAANVLDVTFDDQVALVGWQAPRLSVRPGETLPVLLVWKALTSIDNDYTVFLHLTEDPGVGPATQDDGEPQRGHYPTSLWDPGEVVPDPRSLVIPPDLPEGKYWLVVGLYQLETGQRLLRADGSDGVELASVEVVGP